MPHYHDGTEAKVGDIIREHGDFGRIVGEIIELWNENSAQVAWLADPQKPLAGFRGSDHTTSFAVNNVEGDVEMKFRFISSVPVSVDRCELLARAS